MRQRRAPRVARRLVEVEAEALTGLEHDLAAREGAEPQLRSLHIRHHADRPAGLLLERPARTEALPVIVLSPVADVTPHHGGAPPADHRRRSSLSAARHGPLPRW